MGKVHTAVPFPPEIIAPAWPIRLPGGAVVPAMKATTGLFVGLALSHAAASSSDVPPISPMVRMYMLIHTCTHKYFTPRSFFPTTARTQYTSDKYQRCSQLAQVD
jgi:hypothetical protein